MDRSRVRDFVRGTLGCGCEDAVFERIERALALEGEAPVLKLGIGGRLLVWACMPPDAAGAASRVEHWLSAGLAERGRGGYGRLRLVVGVEQPQHVEAAIRAAFDALPKPDDRVHLHVIDAAALADLAGG